MSAPVTEDGALLSQIAQSVSPLPHASLLTRRTVGKRATKLTKLIPPYEGATFSALSVSGATRQETPVINSDVQPPVAS